MSQETIQTIAHMIIGAGALGWVLIGISFFFWVRRKLWIRKNDKERAAFYARLGQQKIG